MIQMHTVTSEADIAAIIPLLQQLYNHPEAELKAHIRTMLEEQYQLLHATDEDGTSLAAVGYRIGRRLYCGRYLHVDNLVVDVSQRGKGLAGTLIAHLKEIAEKEGCDVILADSYISNTPAHNLFRQHGFHVRGFHLKYDL